MHGQNHIKPVGHICAGRHHSTTWRNDSW